MHFHFLLWILTRKCHSLHITVFCTCFDGFFHLIQCFFSPSESRWETMGSATTPRSPTTRKAKTTLTLSTWRTPGRLMSQRKFFSEFFLLTMITTTIKMFISCTPCVLLVRLVFPFLSPDRIPTQIWNHKIVDATTPVSHQHWLDTNILINYTSCPPQPKPATPAAEPRADDPLLLGVYHRSANHLLDLHQEGQCCHHHPHQRHLHPIKNIFPTINSVNLWRTGWNEPKDDRLPSWKDDRSQRAGHRPCVSLAW